MKRAPNKIMTLAQINDLFIVDCENGIVYRRRGGKVAGGLSSLGYWKLSWRRGGKDAPYKQIYAHKVIWAVYHGKWPRHDLDHINGNKIDNRICNLRKATPSQNMANIGINKTNKSGLKWVSLRKPKPNHEERWQAAVYRKDKTAQAYFRTKEEAFAWASAQAKKLHGQFYNDGLNAAP